MEYKSLGIGDCHGFVVFFLLMPWKIRRLLIILVKVTTFVFSTQFCPDEENARPALSIGSFWVILVGNGMFHYFPHSYTFYFSISVQKVQIVQKTV